MQHFFSKGKGFFSGKKPDPKPIEFHDVPLTPPNKKRIPPTEMTALGASRVAEEKHEGHAPDILDEEIGSMCCPIFSRWKRK